MILNSQNPCPNSVLELALIKVNQKPEFYAWLCHLLHKIGKLSSYLEPNFFICKRNDLNKIILKIFLVIMFMSLWALFWVISKEVVICIRNIGNNGTITMNVKHLRLAPSTHISQASVTTA
jgi:hypothetical protein